MIRVHRLQLLGMVNARGKQVEVRFERSAGVAEVDRPAVGKLRFELSIRQKARKAIGLCLLDKRCRRVEAASQRRTDRPGPRAIERGKARADM